MHFLSDYACPERPSTPGAWRLTLRVTGVAPVRPEPFDRLRTGVAKRSRRAALIRPANLQEHGLIHTQQFLIKEQRCHRPCCQERGKRKVLTTLHVAKGHETDADHGPGT